MSDGGFGRIPEVGGDPGRRLAGKAAIVTGAGGDGPLPGTGEAMARLFARHGAQVAVLDRSADRAEHTAARIRDDGGEAHTVLGDVSDPGDCERMVAEAVGRLGRLDILVNNVGITGAGSVVDISVDDWDTTFAVNLRSVMLMSKYALPHLARAATAAVINISSLAAVRAVGSAPYSASKAGMIGLTRQMAYAHGRQGVRVNCILPGHVHTPMGRQAAVDDTELRRLRREAGLLGTEGSAWDVAWAAVYLASDEARWITGVTLPVDAGATVVAALAMYPYLSAEGGD